RRPRRRGRALRGGPGRPVDRRNDRVHADRTAGGPAPALGTADRSVRLRRGGVPAPVRRASVPRARGARSARRALSATGHASRARRLRLSAGARGGGYVAPLYVAASTV